MLATLLQFTSRHPIGFLGVPGVFGAFIGLLVAVVCIIVFWKIFEIIVAQLNLDKTWAWLIQILRLLLGLAIFLWFVNAIFGIFY